MNRLAALERLAKVSAAMLRGAEGAVAALSSEKLRLEAEENAMRALLDRGEAAFTPVAFVARRLDALGRRKTIVEAELQKAATRVLDETRRLKMVEKKRDAERRDASRLQEAAELSELIERIAAGR